MVYLFFLRWNFHFCENDCDKRLEIIFAHIKGHDKLITSLTTFQSVATGKQKGVSFSLVNLNMDFSNQVSLFLVLNMFGIYFENKK